MLLKFDRFHLRECLFHNATARHFYVKVAKRFRKLSHIFNGRASKDNAGMPTVQAIQNDNAKFSRTLYVEPIFNLIGA